MAAVAVAAFGLNDESFGADSLDFLKPSEPAILMAKKVRSKYVIEHEKLSDLKLKN